MPNDIFQLPSVQSAVRQLDQAGLLFAWPQGVMLLGDAININRELGQEARERRAVPIPSEPIIVAVSMGAVVDPKAMQEFLDGLGRFHGTGIPAAAPTGDAGGRVIDFATRQVRESPISPQHPTTAPGPARRDPTPIRSDPSSPVNDRLALSTDARMLVTWRNEGSHSQLPPTVAIGLHADDYRAALAGGSVHRVPRGHEQYLGIPDNRHVREVVESAVLLIAETAFGPRKEGQPYPTRTEMQTTPRTPARVLFQRLRGAGWLSLIETLEGGPKSPGVI